MPTIVMTGGTSGFGAVAARQLAASPDARLILGARRTASAGESVPLDLSALDSVRGFAGAVRAHVGEGSIGALVLNAGIIRPDVAGRTVDGFEQTFAVNHLAHYLLVRLLIPALADGAVVVLTTSGTHDPATGAGLAPPRHADATRLAFPDRDRELDARPRTAGQHAYTASKLCAVLMVRSLERRLASRGVRATVVAYDPGQVFGTGLVRDMPVPMRAVWSLLGTQGASALRRLSPTLNSGAAAGRALADLALGTVAPPDGRAYAALRRGRLIWPEPSVLARDDATAEALWCRSAELVGCPP